MRRLVMSVMVAAAGSVAAGSTHAEEHYAGIVEAVVDGDTFTMRTPQNPRLRVRVCGIDSPERGEPGYAQAAGALAKMIEGKEIDCIQVGGGTVCDGRSKATNQKRIVAQ